MKRLTVVILILLLCVCACADTYCDTSSRINYFYQLDGGKTDEEGTYDKLLVPVIREITNGAHTSIVPWDNKYLTGRGCDLFAYGHAYQYLCGYAGSMQQKADVLAVYLRGISGQSHTWSTSNPLSTLNPPRACALYAATLDKQPGVSRYSKATGTFGDLYTLFNGCRAACIVNVGGHYVIAVGCTEHEGVKYVLIVDSVMSATLRSDRRGYGYSFDFSTRYDETNARQNEALVHQYWLPYSAFQKCTINYAFYVGQAPRIYLLDSPYKKGAAAIAGETLDLCVSDKNGLVEDYVFEAADPSVATVDENGILTAVAPGETTVSCHSADNPYQVLTIPVYVCDWVHPGAAYIMKDGIRPEVLSGFDLPASFSVDWTEDGTAVIADAYGNEFGSMQYTVFDPEAGGFTHLGAAVGFIGDSAFTDSAVRYVLIDNPGITVSFNAFDGDTELYFLTEDGWYEKR